MTAAPSIVWFRHDLRLADHPALTAALADGGPILPVYVHAPDEEGDWPLGAAARWWLEASLASLDAELRRRGSRLLLLMGPSATALSGLARASGARSLHFGRRYEPAAQARDEAVTAALRSQGLRIEAYAAGLLLEPWELRTQQGGAFQVFTPFWKALQQRLPQTQPLAAPARLPAPAAWPEGLPLEALLLSRPRLAWQDGLAGRWTVSEAAALDRLQAFAAVALSAYPQDRDRPDLDGSSCLSPYLRWGQLSARQVWWSLKEEVARRPQGAQAATAFMRQLAWRDFA